MISLEGTPPVSFAMELIRAWGVNNSTKFGELLYSIK